MPGRGYAPWKSKEMFLDVPVKNKPYFRAKSPPFLSDQNIANRNPLRRWKSS